MPSRGLEVDDQGNDAYLERALCSSVASGIAKFGEAQVYILCSCFVFAELFWGKLRLSQDLSRYRLERPPAILSETCLQTLLSWQTRPEHGADLPLRSLPTEARGRTSVSLEQVSHLRKSMILPEDYHCERELTSFYSTMVEGFNHVLTQDTCMKDSRCKETLDDNA